MAGIDDRAADLNRRLAVPDDEFERGQDEPEDAGDEDQGEDVDDDQDDEDEGDTEEEPPADTRGKRTRAAVEGGPALSAGLVLGFIAYSAAIQLFQGGPARLSGWIKAKLINEPWAAQVNTASATGSATVQQV